MISLITFVIAVFLLAAFLPSFNELLGKQLSLRLIFTPVAAFCFLGIALFTGALAGAYPALYLSAFQPGNILKGLIRSGTKSSLRKVLVVMQFSLTIIMIISTVVLFKQLGFVMNKILGKYAYRTHIGLEIFVLSGLAALLIALLTVSYQAIKAARANPADSLRYE